MAREKEAGSFGPGDTPGVTMHGAALAAAIFVLALANFMSVLDTTIVNVAVPHIAGALAISPSEGTWVITSYAVAEAITVPLSGWLAARFGAVRVFLSAVVGFAICSALCGLSTSLGMLVVFRVMQGLAGGPLMPMSQTLLLRVAPPSQANMALGLWMMTTIVAPIAGPVLGGSISDSAWGWPLAFYINVPVSIVCAFLAYQLLRSRDTARQRNPIDYVGLGFLIVFVAALQIMLDNGEDLDWFSSAFIVGLLIVAILGFLLFLIWELTDKHPIVDLRVFRHRGFAVSAVAMALTYGSFFSSVVLIPLWLQTNMGYTSTWSGYVMGFQGVFGVLMAPIAAMLVSRVDPRIMMSTGLSVLAMTILYRTTFAQNMTYWQLVIPQLAMGFGMPLFFVPMMTIAMGSVRPEETASASGLINFIRTMSGAIATGIVTSAWNNQTEDTRSNLVANLHRPDTLIATLQNGGMAPSTAQHTLDSMVQSQSVMIATNQMFLYTGLIVALTAAGIWLMPRLRGPTQAAMGH